MPFSEIPNPITPVESGYFLQAETAIPGSAESGTTFRVEFFGGMPMGTDVPTPGAWDDWFQGLVDHLAALPSVVSITAGKRGGYQQDCTPTETP